MTILVWGLLRMDGVRDAAARWNWAAGQPLRLRSEQAWAAVPTIICGLEARVENPSLSACGVPTFRKGREKLIG